LNEAKLRELVGPKWNGNGSAETEWSAQKLSKVMNQLQNLDKWSVVKIFVKRWAHLEAFYPNSDMWPLNYHIDNVEEVKRTYCAPIFQEFDAFEEGLLSRRRESFEARLRCLRSFPGRKGAMSRVFSVGALIILRCLVR